MANKVIKLPDEQIQRIKSFQEKMVSLMTRLGDIRVQRYVLDSIESDILKEYDTNRIEERELIKEINEKYGVGKLDMKTGELTIFEQ